MKYIKLTQNKTTLVSDEDYEYCLRFPLYAGKFRNEFRAIWCYRYLDDNSEEVQKTVFLHNLIGESVWGPLQRGFYIYHINRDALDNRRGNLRIATKQQNCFNASKAKSRSSKYKGVSYKKNTNKWLAEISPNRTRVRLGVFEKEKDAARAYNEAAVKYFGEFAVLNVIE